VKDLQDWAAVQKLKRLGKNVTDISRELKMSRTTVYKLLELKEQPVYTRTNYPSKVSPYAEQIIEWRTNPEYDFNGTRIFRELKKLGYKGSISPVYTFLSKLEVKTKIISNKASVRFETPVGDQAQFDWAHYDIWVSGRKRTVYCFSMILSACRKKAVCFSLKADANAIYEAIQELFEDLGGVTLELVIDNPKALVITNNPKSEDEIEYNPMALMLAKHLGTELNACNCYWPRTKGKIERPFDYIEEQFIKGSRFESMEQLNRLGKEFINDWCKEIHGTTKRIPNEFYDLEERQALQPLPSEKFSISNQLTKRIVSYDSFISIMTNKYSLPVKYAGKQVLYRIVYGYRIEVYTVDMEHIISLELKDGKHGTYSNKEHYEDIKVATKSIPQIRRDFSSIFKNGERYLELAGGKFSQPTYHARKIMELLDLYEPNDLDKILEYAIRHDILTIKSIKELIKERGFELINNQENKVLLEVTDESDKLIRSCDYYENIMEGINL
jgi:transposase